VVVFGLVDFLGPLGPADGLLVFVYFAAQPGNGWKRAQRRTEAPPAPTVVARRSVAGIEL